MKQTRKIDKPLDLSDNVVSEATIIERRGVLLSLDGKGPQSGAIDFTGKAYPVTRCLLFTLLGESISCSAPCSRIDVLYLISTAPMGIEYENSDMVSSGK